MSANVKLGEIGGTSGGPSNQNQNATPGIINNLAVMNSMGHSGSGIIVNGSQMVNTT